MSLKVVVGTARPQWKKTESQSLTWRTSVSANAADALTLGGADSFSIMARKLLRVQLIRTCVLFGIQAVIVACVALDFTMSNIQTESSAVGLADQQTRIPV